MAHGDFEKLTPEAIERVWVRLKAGQAAKPTARELGLCTSTVREYLIRYGGIQPAHRRRAACRLSLVEPGGDLPRARRGMLDPVDRAGVGSGRRRRSAGRSPAWSSTADLDRPWDSRHHQKH